jgi:hypothetical protein
VHSWTQWRHACHTPTFVDRIHKVLQNIQCDAHQILSKTKTDVDFDLVWTTWSPHSKINPNIWIPWVVWSPLTRNKWSFCCTHTLNARGFDWWTHHHLLCVTNNFHSLRLINSKQVACAGKWQLGSQGGAILSLWSHMTIRIYSIKYSLFLYPKSC